MFLSCRRILLRVKETSNNHRPLWSNDRDNRWRDPVGYGKHSVDDGKTSETIRNETRILLSYALDYRLLSLKKNKHFKWVDNIVTFFWGIDKLLSCREVIYSSTAATVSIAFHLLYWSTSILFITTLFALFSFDLKS